MENGYYRVHVALKVKNLVSKFNAPFVAKCKFLYIFEGMLTTVCHCSDNERNLY